MFNTFVTTYKVSLTERFNSLVYFVKKIPLIGKKVPDKLYSITKGKEVLAWIWIILDILLSFIGKAIYLGIFIVIPTRFFLKDLDIAKTSVQILFFLSFLFGPSINTSAMDKPERAFTMTRLMMVNTKKYYVSKMWFDRLKEFLVFLPAMMLVYTPVRGLILMIEFSTLRFVFEGFYIFVFKKTKKYMPSIVWFNIVLAVISLCGAYLLPYLNICLNIDTVLYNPLMIIILLCLGIWSFLYLKNYNEYNEINRFITNRGMENVAALKNSDLTFSDVQIEEKNIKSTDLRSKKHENKEGYEYLNALFFERHKNILVKPIIIESVIIALISLAILIFIIVAPQHKSDVMKLIAKTASIWVLVMYFISSSARICRAMFYNCDVSLLRYGYYREGKVILSGFKARVKRVVPMNLIPALEIVIFIIAIVIMCEGLGGVFDFMPMLLSIICLSVFFSIHHMFLYYLLQPYTTDFNIKSPVFNFMNFAVYAISYGCMKLDGTSYKFSIGVIIITLMYVVVGLIATFVYAPKTFKVK